MPGLLRAVRIHYADSESSSMKILACGSRSWTDRALIAKILTEYPKDSLLIHGAAGGADRIAAEEAYKLGMTIKPFPADWSRGRSAGYVRNLQMLDERPDVVLAFWDGSSKGSFHTISMAKKRGILTRVFLITNPTITVVNPS